MKTEIIRKCDDKASVHMRKSVRYKMATDEWVETILCNPFEFKPDALKTSAIDKEVTCRECNDIMFYQRQTK